MKTAAKTLTWKGYALLATAGSAAFVAVFRLASADSAAGVIQPLDRSGATTTTAKRAAAAKGDDIETPGIPTRARIDGKGVANPFNVTGWLPPPPPPPPTVVTVVAPPPPPPPTAPPLPFQFVGMLEDKARPAAFLAKGDTLHIVHAGDTIEDTYRVESLGPSTVVLTYLPLNERQTLSAAGGK